MIQAQPFGNIDGKEAKIYTLQNEHCRVQISDYGATIVGMEVKDAKNEFRDVLLGYDTVKEYAKGNCYFGGLVGRCANRIGNATVEIEGRTYKLLANDGSNHHHSGDNCTAFEFWKVEEEQCDDKHLYMTTVSKEKANGLPGNVEFRACYTLLEPSGIQLTVTGNTDKTTLLNVTSHGYFQLDGHEKGSIDNQYLKIYANEYTPIDENSLPTGERRKVVDSPFDFLTFHKIGERIDSQDEQIRLGKGYDHNYLLDGKRDQNNMTLAAEAWGSESKIQMKIFTNCPCIQFYSGNYIEEQPGKKQSNYRTRSGFCIEPQYIPDAIHLKDFNIPLVKPEERYSFDMILEFSIEEEIEKE